MRFFGKHLRLTVHSSLVTRPASAELILSLALLLILSFSQARGCYSSKAIAIVTGASSAKTAKTPLARLSIDVSVHAKGRGNPQINLADGREVQTAFAGQPELVRLLRQSRARLVAMAAADFDEDGVPDLITGYANSGAGVITLLRGNVDAIYPNSPEAQQRKTAGAFTDAPFLSPALIYSIPQSPDFIGAGDFDCDGHWDVVAAARGDDKLYLLSGDGQGGLRLTNEINLPGAVTALTVGEINRRDGLDDVIVGVDGGAGPQALIYEGPEGALLSQPEIFSFAATVSALALGQLDDEYTQDLAVAAGSELAIIHGRDRKLTLDQISQATVAPARLSRRPLPFAVRSIAVGNFDGQRGEDVAVLAEDGAVYAVNPGRDDINAERNQTTKVVDANWPKAVGLIRAQVSGRAGDDLIVVDSPRRRLSVISGVKRRDETAGDDSPGDDPPGDDPPREIISLDVKGEPVAVLPMRLNGDALSDLVIGASGRSFISVVTTTPSAVFIVNSTGDGQDSNLDDQVCNDGAAACTLRAAIEQSNFLGGVNLINFDIGGGGLQTIAPRSALPAIVTTVMIDGNTQPGFSGRPLIELTGANAGIVSGLRINNINNCMIRGLVINNFAADGILVFTDNNVIEGNFIGVSADGDSSAGNGMRGVEIIFGVNNRIGGTTSTARNVISGNRGSGISTSAPSAKNIVQGNYIGVNAAGAIGLGNLQDGLALNGGGNVIGGTTAGARNIISGNVGGGVAFRLSSLSDTVQGNYIGADAAGVRAISNGTGVSAGDVDVDSTTSLLIGGTAPSAGNVISGNSNFGIYFLRVKDNIVAGNFIGAGAGGSANLGNGFDGVNIGSGSNNVIGGTVPGAGNTIVFNKGSGVFVAGSNNVIVGAASGAGNTIAFNGGDGAQVSSGVGNLVSRNSIFSNSGLGINLGFDGVTPNDASDADAGPNNLQNFPILTSAISDGKSISILGALNSNRGTTTSYTIEFFSNADCDPSGHGQGRSFIGSASVATDIEGNAVINQPFSVAVPRDSFITATATDPAGNTSEFSPCLRLRQITSPGTIPPLVLTKVVRLGGKVIISGILKGESNTTYTITFFLSTSSLTDCQAPDSQKTIIGSIRVATDDDGVAQFENVTFPDPDPSRQGIVNAYAIPDGENPEVLVSGCSLPGALILEISVTPDQIVARGIAFTAEVEVFVDGMGFFNRAKVDVDDDGQRVIQDGRLNDGKSKDGKSIDEAIPPGRRVRIRFRNSDGSQTEVLFKR